MTIALEVIPGIKIVIDHPGYTAPQDGQRLVSELERAFWKQFNSWCALSLAELLEKVPGAFAMTAHDALKQGVIPAKCEIEIKMYGTMDRVALYPVNEKGKRGERIGWWMPTGGNDAT